MDNLLAFLLGFFVCAIGVFVALVFDVGIDKLSSWLKGFTR